MRVLVALGGNALLARGEAMSVRNQRANVQRACRALAPVAEHHELIITHGNGPQVGLLALQAAAYTDVEAYPLDVLGAQTEGMIGYMIEQELGNLLPADKPIATILTMTEVSADDPAFENPTKFVGPVYDEAAAKQMAAEHGWTVKPDGQWYRRVVASPRPRRVFQRRAIECLLDMGAVVVCAGGGGIPTAFVPGKQRCLAGVEAVIDKDLASAVVGRDLDVDLFVIATDAAGVYVDWGTATQRRVVAAHPDALAELEFPAGSMGPKIDAAVAFARTGRDAVIGSLTDLERVLRRQAGTLVSTSVAGIVLADVDREVAE